MPLEHWLTLAMTPGLGPVRITRLLEAFETAEAACGAKSSQLERIDGFGRKVAADVASGLRHARDDCDRELDKADEIGVTILCREDADYPPLLLDIPDPPPVLWVLGELQPRDLNAVGIVGSRRPSLYGKEQAARFAGLLATAGFTVVSGGAHGVDAAAHRGAMRATNGRTIAVLGSGVDVPYPPENEPILAEIAEGCGAVVSEHRIGTQPRKEHFPRRNRIISGMSRGVLVVEADERSGALITARQADEHNRPVFAVPGRVDNPMSAGPHNLLRTGAFLAATLDDVTANLGPLPSGVREPAGVAVTSSATLFEARPAPPVRPVEAKSAMPTATLSDDERRVVEAVSSGHGSPDAVIDATSLPASTVQAALMMLAIKGVVRRGGDGRYEAR